MSLKTPPNASLRSGIWWKHPEAPNQHSLYVSILVSTVRSSDTPEALPSKDQTTQQGPQPWDSWDSWHSAKHTEMPSHHIRFNKWLILWQIRPENHISLPGNHSVDQQHANGLPAWSLRPPTDTHNYKKHLLLWLWLAQINHVKSDISALTETETDRLYSLSPSPSALCINILNRTFKPFESGPPCLLHINTVATV